MGQDGGIGRRTKIGRQTVEFAGFGALIRRICGLIACGNSAGARLNLVPNQFAWSMAWTGRFTRQPAGRPALPILSAVGSLEPSMKSAYDQPAKCSGAVSLKFAAQMALPKRRSFDTVWPMKPAELLSDDRVIGMSRAFPQGLVEEGVSAAGI